MRMKVLLDTHAFLWRVTDDQRLSFTARDLIGDRNNTVLVSAATAWEIAIKAGLSRIELPDIFLFIDEDGIESAMPVYPNEIYMEFSSATGN